MQVRCKRHRGADLWLGDQHDCCREHDLCLRLTGDLGDIDIKEDDDRIDSRENDHNALQVWELKAQGCAMLVNYDGAGSDGSGTAGKARLV